MAQFNLEYYKGADLYSDGSIEDNILEFVRNGKTLEELGQTENSYAFAYHLAKDRENILNWYPFTKATTVLEIGSGCGAISGLLAEKCGKVVSVELSRRRATINYERHKQYDNLEIIVGNLNDIDFGEKFDYIVLNGVFEYAASFTQGSTPYETFLTNIIMNLKKDGRILIAIENRLGLKYFAGAAEDHTNLHFLGLNNYKNVNTVRTFSKGEMKEICEKVGLKYVHFFYPYPDYKFPTEIFTDETINTMGYGRTSKHFEKDRIELFNIESMYRTLENEKVADKFANSFLVEAAYEEWSDDESVIYAKLNSNRKDIFRIRTRIIKNKDGERTIIKDALCKNAQQHINRLKQNSNKISEALSDEAKECDYAKYEFIKDNNLDSIAKQYIERKNAGKIIELLKMVYEEFLGDGYIVENVYSEGFVEVFGKAEGRRSFECKKNLNIDLILDNIYYRHNHFTVIDCEWCFEFPIPVQFVIWRTINEMYYKYPELYDFLDRNFIYKEFGFDSADASIFLLWAIAFAEKYVGDNHLSKFYCPTISLPLEEIVNEYKDREFLRSKLYINYGEGYSEDQVILKEKEIKDGYVRLKYNLSGNIKTIRWDPCEVPCKCKNVRFVIDDIEVDNRSNCNEKNDGDYFLHFDPQYECVIMGSVHTLYIECYLEFLNTKTIVEHLENEKNRLSVKNEELNNKMEDQKSELKTIQESRIWKYTEWLRKISITKNTKSEKTLYNLDVCKYENNKLELQGWFVPTGNVSNFIIQYRKGEYCKNLDVVDNIERPDVVQILKNEGAIRCGFAAEWNVANLKRGKIVLLYTCDGYEYCKVLANCGISIRDEMAFYFGEIKKNGIRPYLSYLKPANFVRFLELRTTPSSIYNSSEVQLFPNIMNVMEQYVREEPGKNYFFDDEIFVIVPVYNGIQYLDALFEGIYKTNIQFKLIIIDDCSPDVKVQHFLQKVKQNHNNVILLENETNRGFLPTVNRGLEYAKGHVALVNTDVQLPFGWLERLMYPIVKDDSIASTTPFTNSGTICSFPNFCKDNRLFCDLSVDQIDDTFKYFKPMLYEMPTGVGFCMGMNKNAIQKVGVFDEENFGKGYGEENDWCQRAIKCGYKNVQVCNLFAFHNHGGSFPSEEKKRLLEEHRLNLIKKHPRYEMDVAKYCTQDPAAELRKLAEFDLILKSEKKKILYFNHALGGGADDYLKIRRRELCANGEVVAIITYNYQYNVYNIAVEYQEYILGYTVSKLQELKELVAKYQFNEVVINELVTYPDLYDCLHWIADYAKITRAKLVMLLHDYFAVCPTINLLNEEGKYCRIENCEECNLDRCSVGCASYQSIDKWKEEWYEFLTKCDEVRVFSNDSQRILEKQYGKMQNINLVPHQVNYMPKLNKRHKTTNTLNIGLLGVLSKHKGADIIRRMLEIIRERNMNVRIILIGYLDATVSIQDENFIETGRYNIGELPKKIFQNDIDIFLIPSIWPETFSYTTQEIIELQMPIAVFDLGAPAERVKAYKDGIVIPEISAESALDSIIEFKQNSIVEKANSKRILFVAEYISFSSRYRVEHLQEQLAYRYILSDFIEVENADQVNVEDYDKLVIYRCRKSNKLDILINKFKEDYKEVLYDIDDYIFDYKAISELPFLKDEEYKDFEKYSNDIHACMDIVDGFITSTQNMVDVISREFVSKKVILNRNIASAEMLINSLRVKNNAKRHDRVVLGYFSGSKTHDGDFMLISDIILKLLEEYDNLYLEIGGCLQLGKNYDQFLDRIERFDFVDWRELPKKIQQCDINLMPLENTIFHACKSENKWMEAALVGVPTVASRNTELELCILDRQNGFLCEEKEEWLQTLKMLIETPDERKRIGENAYEYCYKNKTTLTAEVSDSIWR